MENLSNIIFISTLTVGFIFGAFFFWLYHLARVGGYTKLCDSLLQKAGLEADQQRRQKLQEVEEYRRLQEIELEKLAQKREEKRKREELRIEEKEEKLEKQLASFERKMAMLELKEQEQQKKAESFELLRQQNVELNLRLNSELENLAAMSVNEARERLLESLTEEVRIDAAKISRRLLKEAEEKAEVEATKIITTAINRLAVSVVSQSMVYTIELPNEEMKGRIIGRDGRNIRTLEKATGVNFVIDDTPGTVLLSGFDPVRIQIARMTLKELISDGRIFPSRIEELVEKSKEEIAKRIKEWGEEAALRAGAMTLHPELIKLLGRLKLRYSLGQNVLDHSLEVSYLMGMMAEELGLDSRLAKRIGLLHDIGKAVSHEVEGSHALIGHDFALKYGETQQVANGIGCHHNEMEPITAEGALTAAADAISASRPGGRIEAIESYVKRLKKLEELAYEFEGVAQAYAMQAGRELLIIVDPTKIEDDKVALLSYEIAKQIEKELTYPGKIKVAVLRERREEWFAQ